MLSNVSISTSSDKMLLSLLNSALVIKEASACFVLS